jgi:hypothetical protein
MNVSRIVEVRMFDSLGQPTFNYDLEVSSNLLTKKWSKMVYRVLREAMTVCMSGGMVVMRGVIYPKF